jgi:hypothetical protein
MARADVYRTYSEQCDDLEEELGKNYGELANQLIPKIWVLLQRIKDLEEVVYSGKA